MRILLIGEFSGLHNNLKDGLKALGHDVILASTGDGWKQFPSDINWLPKKFKGKLGYLEFLYRQCEISTRLSNFDVVQFISNYLLFDKRFGIDKYCYNNLIKNNAKSYFIVAGGDPNIWQYWQEANDGLMSNLISETNKFDLNTSLVKKLLSVKERQKVLNLTAQSDGVIPIMYEYAEPYRNIRNLCPTIPIPINLDKIKYCENIPKDKLVVFHGLNRKGAKGTKYVEQAFEILKKRYPNDLELVIAGKMKYNDYVGFMKNVNVIIDQTNSYSLGISGLISLAQGKVTLGGGEQLGNQALGYTENPVINIEPSVQSIIDGIEKLLDLKNEIEDMGEKSRLFVEKYHNCRDVAEKYVNVWNR